MSSSSPSNDQSPYEYYASFTDRPSLQNIFRDIDEESCFNAYNRRLRDSQTQNFVLDFGNEDAWCAMNLSHEDFSLLLRKPVSRIRIFINHGQVLICERQKPNCFGTRWM
jgi:hypothetical protein